MENFEKFEIRQISHLKQPTIYYFLKDIGISETHIKHLRRNPSSILLNGVPTNTRAKIFSGDSLEISKSETKPTEIAFCDGKLEILHEDDDFLFVNKPHNLACTPTRSHYGMNLGGQICKYMREKDPNFVLRILNRLDRETAGIVAVAKNVLAYNATVKTIEKEYHAIACGNIYENITIDKPISTFCSNGINEMKRAVSPDGKRAVTHVEVIRNFSIPSNFGQTEKIAHKKFKSDHSPQQNFCHIKLLLETGRTHQIRVHLSSIGHPLLGDKLYGEPNSAPNTAEHTMLILKKASFTHFRTGKKICIEIPFPPEWNNYI